MAVTVVPLNTMLADLDETLRAMLKRDLGRHGFDGVEIVFDAPSKDWSAQLSSPTVNLFMYDLREAIEHRPTDWVPKPGNGGRPRELRPPLRLDASYAVTAWTRAVEDEHRLLSQVLATLYAYPELPQDIVQGTLADEWKQRYPLYTRVAQARQEGKADFWNSVGGQYKASIDYVVTCSVESGTEVERGPEVRTQTIRVVDRDLGRARMEEFHRLGGRVLDAEGEPVGNAWVVASDLGWAATGADGRFRFDRVIAGSYVLKARAPDGSETQVELTVPTDIFDVTLGASKPKAKSGSKKTG
jgi:Pvc16 N-terminal domain/Carboxypeptidase regulatory-like domain